MSVLNLLLLVILISPRIRDLLDVLCRIRDILSNSARAVLDSCFVGNSKILKERNLGRKPKARSLPR